MLAAILALGVAISADEIHATPAAPAWASLGDDLRASVLWRCSYLRFNKYTDKKSGRGHQWQCELHNMSAQAIRISIRIHAKDVADPGEHFGRATIDPGDTHVFRDFTTAPAAAGVTMWWRNLCSGDPLECSGAKASSAESCPPPGRVDLDVKPQIGGKALSPLPARVLYEVAKTAQCPAPAVSRFESTSEHQTDVLYGVIQRTDRSLTEAQAATCLENKKVKEVAAGPVDGLTAARCQYNVQAAPVFDAYEAHRDEEPARVKKEMLAALRKMLAKLGDTRLTMMHVDGKNYAFDVKPSSVRCCEARFLAALKAHPDVIQTRLFTPDGPAEAAYHIEVARPSVPSDK